jgi:Ca2+/Na+ antiporter
MNARLITNVLLGIVALILVFHWWPIVGVVFVGLAVAYWLWSLWKAKQAQRKKEKAARIAAEIEPLYQEYVRKRKALREKHDPEHKWPEFRTNDMPSEYRDEIDALTEGYKGVLVLKFGDHILMPK